MKAEYPENRSCPQKDNAEHEEYAGAQSVGCREVAKQDGADLLERILILADSRNTAPPQHIAVAGGIDDHTARKNAVPSLLLVMTPVQILPSIIG